MPVKHTARAQQVQDLTGRRFGRLVVVERSENTPSGGTRWKCVCDCGVVKAVIRSQLIGGHTVSCSCHRNEQNRRARGNLKHGCSDHPLYYVWRSMINRCHNPDSSVNSFYGARGISVCGRWRESFEAFVEDMGPRPEGRYSIDRKDNDGDYEPGNCRWATTKEQTRNFRRNHMIEFDGRTMCVTDWAASIGVNYTSLLQRLRSGWSVEAALTTPFRKRKAKVV